MNQRDQPLLRLLDANPAKVVVGARVVGIAFDCPIHDGCRLAIPTNPSFDGKPPISWFANNNTWKRSGDDFDSMTLSPSIDVRGDGVHDCDWHGFIISGRFR